MSTNGFRARKQFTDQKLRLQGRMKTRNDLSSAFATIKVKTEHPYKDITSKESSLGREEEKSSRSSFSNEFTVADISPNTRLGRK